ncbi:cysteine-rich repeat secretory protein 38-like [Dioscorea cayenensis subsp. rotundata]|uniref:Cysteine-rich repeat secretory protein 38-like n=1 Tax=Dioscorea cayennensis subsp. rotundata TaxID=55577 RepID=A0AB40B713_DIOCR|nr:cysteine-rich repeat secretory protein 38-like [Dioscorea cayenensis subsp. rotundata]
MKRYGLLLLLHRRTIFSFFYLLIQWTFLHAYSANLTLESRKTECTGSTDKQNSNFSANLNSLLSTLEAKSLSSLSTNQTSGDSPATVFGLYFCTGDLSKDNCQACIQTAIKDIIDTCPSSKQAIIWYDYCELRYSDVNFFGVPDTNGFSMINDKENTTSTRPVEVVSQLVREAPTTPLMFKSQALIS